MAQKGYNDFIEAFERISLGEKKMSSVVKAYNPPYSDSKDAYDHIKKNIDSWVEAAIKIRDDYTA